MLTALDTNVLLDVFWEDPVHSATSTRAIQRAAVEGQLIVCEVVWAELRAAFPSVAALTATMATLDIAFSPLTAAAATAAGEFWSSYRSSGGSRSRLLPDFLIAGHALHQADRLLTRDRGFYRSYFPELTILDPAAS